MSRVWARAPAYAALSAVFILILSIDELAGAQNEAPDTLWSVRVDETGALALSPLIDGAGLAPGEAVALPFWGGDRNGRIQAVRQSLSGEITAFIALDAGGQARLTFGAGHVVGRIALPQDVYLVAAGETGGGRVLAPGAAGYGDLSTEEARFLAAGQPDGTDSLYRLEMSERFLDRHGLAARARAADLAAALEAQTGSAIEIAATERVEDDVATPAIALADVTPGETNADEDVAVLAAVLPSSRAVAVGDTATAFATLINPAGSVAEGCGLQLVASEAAGVFSFQETDAANAPVGTPDAVVDIEAGGAASFVFAFTPSAAFEPGGDLPIEFFCANRLSAPITSGLNTLFFTASDAGGPDMVALAETGSAVGLNTDPGIIDIIDRGSAGAFVVATANVGSAGEVTVRAEPSDPDLPVTVRLCETDPATGACLAPRANEVTFTAEAGGSNSFALAAFGSDFVAFDPAGARVNVIFEQAGSRRGSTSVAVRTLLTEPVLPETPYAYNDALPAHFTGPVQGFGNLANQDNTPAGNPVTDAGATLGRVLFFDRRLSADNSVSCGSCHTAATGFSDPDRLSSGFDGGLTGRHSPGLSNARYYQRGHFFWDERADTLEDQVLMPIQDAVEMGLTLDQAVAKLEAAGFYGPLFEDAFGDDAITSERMALAMAQFVRAMVSYRSRFDEAFAGGGAPDFESVFTEEEWLGAQLFGRIPGASVDSVGCDRCHIGVAQVADEPRNIGLDLVDEDEGAGNGTFKPPSLRNIGERGPYMHDGRFDTLAQVVEHYNSGVQANPNVDGRLTGPGGNPIRLNLTQEEKDALVAFMLTLTDETFLNDERFSDPFQR